MKSRAISGLEERAEGEAGDDYGQQSSGFHGLAQQTKEFA
jgi:hypothetical protein